MPICSACRCVTGWRRAALLIASLCLPGCDDAPANADAVDSLAVEDARRGAPEAFSVRARELAGSREPGDTLRAERVIGDSAAFGEVTSVRPVGGHLLVIDRLTNFHLALVDRRSGRVVHHFGRHGKGPREFTSPSSIHVSSGAPTETWIYDFDNRRFTHVRLAGGGRAEVLEEVSLNVGPSLLEPAPLGERIVANGLFDGYALLVMDRRGRPVKRLAVPPPFGSREMEHPTGRRLLNRTFLTTDPAGRRLALAYQFANRLDFFTAAGDYLGTASGPRSTRTRFHVKDGRFFWEPENEMTYAAVHSSDRYVYALYCGCAMKDRTAPTRVHVFRWDGRFVAEIALDRPAWNLAVTPDDERLFGGTTDPHPGVAEWRLPAGSWGAYSNGGEPARATARGGDSGAAR